MADVEADLTLYRVEQGAVREYQAQVRGRGWGQGALRYMATPKDDPGSVWVETFYSPSAVKGPGYFAHSGGFDGGFNETREMCVFQAKDWARKRVEDARQELQNAEADLVLVEDLA